jgi:hypothetical protein
MASKTKPSNVSYKEGLVLGIAGFFFGIYISFFSIWLSFCLPFAGLFGKIRKE